MKYAIKKAFNKSSSESEAPAMMRLPVRSVKLLTAGTKRL